MWASLLPNGNLVGTGEASRQSLSQSPVLGRHGNKQRGVREMGERSQREAGRCMIISDPVTCSSHDTQPCGHPVCFTDQRTQSLLSSSVPLTQTGSTPPPLTHTHTQAHTHTHTHTHTQAQHSPPHTALHTLTHSSLTLTHPHILLTHLNTSLAHPSHTPQTHTLFTPTYTLTHTHPHTLTHTHSSYPHTHTPSHTPHLHTYTHTTTEPTGVKTQETQGQCSHTRHVERVGTAQSPR